MNPKMRRVLFISGIVVVLGATSLILPQALALSLQIQGGQKLEQSLITADDIPDDAVLCAVGSTGDPAAQALAQEAVEKLDKALEYNDRLSQAYLQLGRVYCLLGEPAQAVQAYESFINLRPNNPLGHLELGFALEAACQVKGDREAETSNSIANKGICSDLILRENIVQEWKTAQLVVGYFFDEAYSAFALEDMENAARWFQRGIIFGGVPSNSPDLYKWSISHIATGRPLVDAQLEAISFQQISTSSLLEGENLLWMKDIPPNDLVTGDPLSKFPTGSSTVGVMWWAGPAIAFINIPESSTYEITIRITAKPPGPITVQMEKDFIPIDRFNLDPSNPEWSEIKTATVLPAGPHILVIRFLDDTGDVMIDWIQLDAK